jgi:membrane-associated phospholipid phosphatase
MSKSPLKTQSRFWDFCNALENPIIHFLQFIFLAGPLATFWLRVAKLGSATLFSFAPLVLFCLGCPHNAKRLALSFVFYALFSSMGKFWIRRRRPFSYDGVVCANKVSTSSFPSRHSIGVTIFAAFLWEPLQIPYLALLVVDRLAAGMHYLTDCLVGVAIGLLALKAAEFVENVNLMTMLLVLALQVWASGAKILGGGLPVLIAPAIVVGPYCILLAFLKYPILWIIRKGRKEKETLQILSQELLVTSLILFVAVKMNGWLMEYEIASLMPWEKGKLFLSNPGCACGRLELEKGERNWRSIRGIMKCIGL